MDQCIYCGKHYAKLSDEHTIPEGLGGDQLLKNASCQSCADITSRIELRVLRHSYGFREVRSALGIGKRRQKDKPNTAGLVVEFNTVKTEIEVPLTSHPLLFSLTLFDYPTMLSGRPDPAGIGVVGCHRYSLGPDPKLILGQLGTDNISGRQRAYDNDFGKFLAKVAWCCWVAEYGPASLEEAWLPSVVIGEEPVVGRYVGSLDYAVVGSPADACLHSVHFEITGRDDHWLATARIQLFRQLTPCPTYVICIGHVSGDTANCIKTNGWKLPQQGAIGRPLRKPLPKYIATTMFGFETKELAKASPIYKELRAIGVCQ